ncbi:MAG: fimbrillin family protein [Bacteroidales bacterium]|nr:fimbrillin family protein [Bacteroidales bacterium]
MKRISYIFTAVVLTAIVLAPACSKDSPSPKDEMPEWATDITKEVPIILSTGSPSIVKTKAAITSLEGVEFGVLAYDATNMDELFRDEVAKSVSLQAQFISKEDGTSPITKYYPLYNPDSYNYSFYAWHTSDTKVKVDSTIFNLDKGTHTKTFDVGQVDVLWAKADATSFEVGSGEEAKTYTGFNAEYQRAARKNLSSWENYLPKLTFKHLTAALHFQVVAEDADAAATFVDKYSNPLVTLTALNISSGSDNDITSQATLDVLTGDIQATATADSLAVTAYPLLPTEKASEFGTGLFIMPTNDNLRVQFTLAVPTGAFTPTDGTGVGYALSAPDGGFVAGKSYTYKIIIRSLENIQIKLELEEWNEAPINDNVIATIG